MDIKAVNVRDKLKKLTSFSVRLNAVCNNHESALSTSVPEEPFCTYHYPHMGSKLLQSKNVKNKTDRRTPQGSFQTVQEIYSYFFQDSLRVLERTESYSVIPYSTIKYMLKRYFSCFPTLEQKCINCNDRSMPNRLVFINHVEATYRPTPDYFVGLFFCWMCLWHLRTCKHWEHSNFWRGSSKEIWQELTVEKHIHPAYLFKGRPVRFWPLGWLHYTSQSNKSRGPAFLLWFSQYLFWKHGNLHGLRLTIFHQFLNLINRCLWFHWPNVWVVEAEQGLRGFKTVWG